MENNFSNFKDIVATKKSVKPPAHKWQELALRVIEELKIPINKKNSVFKICKSKSRNIVEQALNDTKELCRSGEKWKYFFKIIEQTKK